VVGKKVRIILVIFLFLLSCSEEHTEIKYTYEDITVTRVDQCAKTTFYYSSPNVNKTPKIWVEYHGLSGDFTAYLKFDTIGEKKAKIVSVNSAFEVEFIDPYFSARDFDRNNEGDKSINIDPSAYYIYLIPSIEIRDGNKKTEVKAEYKINKIKRAIMCGRFWK
jgi:hypothetical protein